MSQEDTEELKVKKPHQEEPLTPEQEKEWIKCANDKVYWMENYVYVQGDGGIELFKPREYQKRIINTAETNRFVIALCGRQGGKTTTLGIDVLHECIFQQNYHVGITSYRLDNTRDYIDRIRFSYEELPFWMKPPVKEYNKYNIKFTNNTSIRSQVTKTNTFRGVTLDRIISDELAFVLPDIAEQFWGSLLPSISAKGKNSKTKLNVISTPNGTSGTFAGLWSGAINKVNGFTPVEVKYDEIPGRDEQFEADMIEKIGKIRFLQEFKCHFISSKGTLINSQILEAIETKEPIDEYFGLRIYVNPNSLKGRTIAIACDVSEGIGQDYHAIEVFDINSFEQVAEFHHNLLTQTMYSKEVIRFIKYFFEQGVEEIYYTVESNGLGKGVIRLLENYSDPLFDQAMMVNDPEKPNKNGLEMTPKTKRQGCSELKDLIEMGQLKIHSELLKTQFKFFVKSGETFKAESGAHDDLCMACVLMANMFTILQNYEDKVYDVMSEIDMENEDEELWGIIF